MPPKKAKAKRTTKTPARKQPAKRRARKQPGKRVRIDEYAAQAAREKAFQAEAAVMLANAEATAKIVTATAPALDAAKPSPEAMAQMETLRDHMLKAQQPE